MNDRDKRCERGRVGELRVTWCVQRSAGEVMADCVRRLFV